MDSRPCRCAMRFVGYTLAMTAMMILPALLQAMLVMRPNAISVENAGALMSCAFAAALVMVPALLQALLDGDHGVLPP